MKTNKKQLEELRAAKEAADKAFFAYRSEYNKEHGTEKGIVIKTIIMLHKQGLTNGAITALGYNKNTVNRQVRLYTKGKKVEKTIVRQYLPTDKKAK